MHRKQSARCLTRLSGYLVSPACSANPRAVSIQMESALVFIADAFSTVNRIHLT